MNFDRVSAQDQRPTKAIDISTYPNVTGIVILIGVGLVTYVPQMKELGLYLDDWRMFSYVAFYGRQVNVVMRPMNFMIWDIGGWLLDLDKYAYLVAALTLHCIAAIALWRLLWAMLPARERPLGLAIAVLYLVYPSYFSRVWITTWPSGLLVALVLIGAAAYVAYLKTDKWHTLLFALALFALTLGWYEMQLALIAALPILGIKHLRSASWSRRLGIMAPTLLAGFFGVLWLASTGGDAYGTTPVNWSEVLLAFPERIWMGWITVLIYAWTDPLRTLVPFTASNRGLVLALVTGISLTIVLYALFDLAARRLMPQWVASNSTSAAPISTWLAHWAWQLALAAGVVIGGMLPVLLMGTPWISTLESRLTLFSAIGGAAFVILIIYGAGRIVFQDVRRAQLFTYAGAITLLAVAIPSQWAARSGMVAAWQNQQCVWRAMFTLAPAYGDGAWVHIMDVPPPAGLWKMAPFQGLDSEVGSAVQLLYNNKTLYGDFASVDEQERWGEQATEYLLQGLKPRQSEEIIPWDRVVMFRYRPGGALERVQEIFVGEPGVGQWVRPGVERVLSQEAVSPYRSLIVDDTSCP